MAVTEAFVLSAVTVGATELSILSGTTTLQNNTTPGAYQLFLDPVTNLLKGDVFQVRIYEKVKSAGTKRVVFTAQVAGAQVENYVFPTLMLLNGWDMTLQKIAGTDRAFDASIRKAG